MYLYQTENKRSSSFHPSSIFVVEVYHSSCITKLRYVRIFRFHVHFRCDAVSAFILLVWMRCDSRYIWLYFVAKAF